MDETMFHMENTMVDSWFFIYSMRPGCAGLKKNSIKVTLVAVIAGELP